MIIQLIGIVSGYLRENYRNIVITTISLIFITAILTVTLSSEQILKRNYLENELQEIGDKSMILETIESIDVRYFHQKTLEAQAFYQQKVTTFDINYLYTDLESTPPACITTTVRTPNFYRAEYGSIEETQQNILGNSSNFKGRLPKEPNEVILVTEDPRYTTSQYQLNQTYTLNVIQDYFYTDTDVHVTIVGIYETIMEPVILSYGQGGELSYSLADKLIADNPIIPINAFLTNYEFFNQSLPAEKHYVGSLRTQFTLNFEKINYRNFRTTLTNFERFANNIDWSESYNAWRFFKFPGEKIFFHRDIETINEFDQINSNLRFSFLFSWVGMIPALIIALFFASFVSKLYSKRRTKQVRLLRLRSTKNYHLLIVSLVEFMITLLPTIFIGYLLGLLLTSLTSGVKRFHTYTFDPSAIQFSMSTFQAVILWSFVILSILSFFKIKKTVMLKAHDNLERDLNETPLYRRLYLDIFIFILGIIGNYIFLDNSLNNLVYSDATQLLSVFFVPFPILLLIGGISTVSRLVIPFTNIIARISFNKMGNLFSYSLLNIIREKEKVISFIILISIIFSLTWATFTVPGFESNVEHSLYYEVGSDAYYNSFWTLSAERELKNASCVVDWTKIGKLSLTRENIDLIIIFPEFLEIAYYEERFGASIHNIKRLFEEPLSCLMSSETLSNKRLSIEEHFNIIKPDNQAQETLKILDTFNLWPRFQISYKNNVVISNTTLHYLQDKQVIKDSISINAGYYLKLQADMKLSQLYEEFDVYEIETPLEGLNEYRDSLFNRAIVQQLNLMLLISIMSLMMSVMLSGLNDLSFRNREIVVERALGMRLSQMTQMFMFEASIKMILSYFFGLVLGLIFAMSLSTILFLLSSSLLPPPLLIIPFIKVNIVLIPFMTLGIIAGIIPAILVRKQNLSERIKVM